VGSDAFLMALACLLGAAIVTAIVRKLAVAHGLLDVPNERSSHGVTTPRGGGLSVVLLTSVAALVLTQREVMDFDFFIASTGGGLAVGLVGFLDDRRPLPAAIRLAVHVAAALWALTWLGGLPPLQFGEHLVRFGWEGYLLGVVLITWALNLFNFMDGIDGLAASEAIYVAWGAAALAAMQSMTGGIPELALAFGAACAGFLVWNWPRARIFMGDVGSGYMGYLLALMAIGASRHDSAALWVWLILGGLFFMDASVTLLRRVLQGVPIQEAHRTHAYQWLARRWRSHRRVTLAAAAVNLLWLLPCAFLATSYPTRAMWIALVALVPIGTAAILAGAGRRETPPA
jgi:Fuc2NAc and GlcNAc transferase